jgi:multiple sugar transport system permease protein
MDATINTNQMLPSAPVGDLPKPTTRLFYYGLLIFFGLLMIMPFVYSLANSFKTLPDIASNQMLLYPTQGVTTSGYQRVLGQGFLVWFGNSIRLSLITMMTHLVIDSLAGYALARIRFPGRSAIFYMFLATLMIPGVVLMVPRFLVFTQLGLIGTPQGIILPMMTGAFGIFLMKQFFENLPPELEDAAAIDGCGRFRMFYNITLPLALPGLIALAIFSFQASWNELAIPLIVAVQNRALWTVQLGLSLIRGQTGQGLNWDVLLPGAVLTMMPMIFIFFFFQRFFVQNTAYTGIKG